MAMDAMAIFVCSRTRIIFRGKERCLDRGGCFPFVPSKTSAITMKGVAALMAKETSPTDW